MSVPFFGIISTFVKMVFEEIGKAKKRREKERRISKAKKAKEKKRKIAQMALERKARKELAQKERLNRLKKEAEARWERDRPEPRKLDENPY